jgi:hypothetical protein
MISPLCRCCKIDYSFQSDTRKRCRRPPPPLPLRPQFKPNKRRGKKPRAGRLLETALGPVRVSFQASESVTAVIKKSNAWLLKKTDKKLNPLELSVSFLKMSSPFSFLCKGQILLIIEITHQNDPFVWGPFFQPQPTNLFFQSLKQLLFCKSNEILLNIKYNMLEAKD